MFKLEAFNPEAEAKNLRLSDQLFHEALKEVPQSMARFHVANGRGAKTSISSIGTTTMTLRRSKPIRSM